MAPSIPVIPDILQSGSLSVECWCLWTQKGSVCPGGALLGQAC